MDVYVVSDHELIGTQVRQIVLSERHECPSANLISLDLAALRLSKAQPGLVILVLEPDAEHALAVMSVLPTTVSTRVFAVGRASDPKLMLRALRNGADDYVDFDDLDAELRSALKRFETGRTMMESKGRLIAVLAPSGGSGSSTLAANVATVLAKEHKSVALVDMKLESGDLAALLDLKPTYTLADFCMNAGRMDREMFERTLTRHSSGVCLLPPPKQLADVHHVTAEGVRQAFVLARAAYPYVVTDLDHSFREEQLQVIRQADVILLVLRLEFAALKNAKRTLEHLEKLGIDKDRIKLVVNRYGQPQEMPAAKAEEVLGMKVFHYVPDEPKTVNCANNNGVPLVIESPSAKISKSVSQLAINVNGRHKAK